MKNGFEQILDACLDRIVEKGESIEQCLRAYPEHAAELEPLLRAALSVREASSAVKPRPEFERVAKHRLLSALESKEKVKTQPRMPFWGWRRRWAVALAAIVILVLIGGSTVTASASSLPGDVLYPVKTATEKVQGFFTFGREAKASFHIKLAQRRLNELELLTEGNRSIPQSVLNAMGTETETAIEILGRDKPAKEELVIELTSVTSAQSAVLQEVMERVPPQARLELQEALRKAEHAHNMAKLLRGNSSEGDEMKPVPSVPGMERVWPGLGGGNETGVGHGMFGFGSGNKSGNYSGGGSN